MRRTGRRPSRCGPSAKPIRMSDASKIPEAVWLAAEQQGLAKALKLYPDSVKAAAERGLKPLGALPKGTTSISSPAPVFNPARFERDE